MAYIKAAEIQTRIRELIEDGAGSYRAISATRFSGGLHDGLSSEEQARLGVISTKPVEATITAIRPHPQRLTIVGDVQLYEIEVSIKVVRTIAIDGQVDDDTRDAIKALAFADGDALAQSLEWPGNLTQTTAGDATDLQALVHKGSSHRVLGTAGSAMRLESIHRFTGTAIARPATS